MGPQSSSSVFYLQWLSWGVADGTLTILSLTGKGHV
jgi:hypothetical protein